MDRRKKAQTCMKLVGHDGRDEEAVLSVRNRIISAIIPIAMQAIGMSVHVGDSETKKTKRMREGAGKGTGKGKDRRRETLILLDNSNLWRLFGRVVEFFCGVCRLDVIWRMYTLTRYYSSEMI